MTTYGDEKRLDMARSVLPASARARKAARAARRQVHHRTRADQRTSLATSTHDDDYDERPVATDRRGEVRENVRRRREADKLGPLIRWANANAHRLGPDPASRRTALRAILPDGIIGDHAMTHIEREPAFRVGPPPSWLATRRESDDDRRRRLAAALRCALVERADRFGELNALLKARWVPVADHPEVRPRLLLGLHDVDAFVDDITRQWMQPVFCRACRRYHGAMQVDAVREFCGTGSAVSHNRAR